jgi:CHASE2 domain-containing sensor protein
LKEPIRGQYSNTVKWKLPNLSRWRAGLIGAALATVAGLGFLVSPLGSGLAGLSYDSFFLFRANVPVQDVAILYMDLESETRLGQKRRQSWDRAQHARLLDRLKDYGPRAVVFDVLFVPSPDDPGGDEKLVQAARASRNVVVAAKTTPDIDEGQIVGWQLTPPFPTLREVVTWGVSEAAQSDRTIRRHHHREDLDAPSMAWRVAEKTMRQPPAPFQPRWINYYGPPGFLPHFSYYQLFETNAIPLAALSNNVVFVGGLYDIGFAGGKRSDDYPIPHTRWTGRRSPGVEISATAYLNLARGDWLRRLSPWTEVCVVLLCGCIGGFMLATRRPVAAVGWALLGFVLVGAVAIFLAWQSFIWFPWLIVSAVQIPVAAGWSVLAHTKQLYHEKRVVEQALAMASRGEGSPAFAGDSRTVPIEGILTPFGGLSPTLTPTSAAGGLPAAPGRPPMTTVADHELLCRIGRGAYGEVYLARDVIGAFHAVKIVRREGRHDPVALEREFKGLKNFTPISRSHPGFVHILQVGRNEEAGCIYYVMELADDENTGQKIDPENYSARTLARELRKRGRLPLSDCLRLCLRLTDALGFLHQHKLIHRDIKPANIIFVGGQPKFADIGLVTEVVAEGREVSVIGTPGRMAPEGPGEPAADLYSLGKVLYEAGFGMDLTRFPELPSDLVQSADESALFEFNRIVMKACDFDLRRRYRTAADLQADLVTLQRHIGEPPG